MRFYPLLVGFLLFSLTTYVFLTAAGDGGQAYNSRDYATYQGKVGQYNYLEEVATGEDNSSIRSIGEKLKSSGSTSGATAVFFLDNAIDATKLITSSVTTTQKIASDVSGDNPYIDPFFISLVSAIVTIATILMVLYMLMRAKGET